MCFGAYCLLVLLAHRCQVYGFGLKWSPALKIEGSQDHLSASGNLPLYTSHLEVFLDLRLCIVVCTEVLFTSFHPELIIPIPYNPIHPTIATYHGASSIRDGIFMHTYVIVHIQYTFFARNLFQLPSVTGSRKLLQNFSFWAMSSLWAMSSGSQKSVTIPFVLLTNVNISSFSGTVSNTVVSFFSSGFSFLGRKKSSFWVATPFCCLLLSLGEGGCVGG